MDLGRDACADERRCMLQDLFGYWPLLPLVQADPARARQIGAGWDAAGRGRALFWPLRDPQANVRRCTDSSPRMAAIGAPIKKGRWRAVACRQRRLRHPLPPAVKFMAKGDGMELLPIRKRVIGLDIHQAEITACAIIEESSGEAQTGRPQIYSIPACGCVNSGLALLAAGLAITAWAGSTSTGG